MVAVRLWGSLREGGLTIDFRFPISRRSWGPFLREFSLLFFVVFLKLIFFCGNFGAFQVFTRRFLLDFRGLGPSPDFILRQNFEMRIF